jgi:uncharacterized membrane protein
MTTSIRDRDVVVDVMRGLAIFTMIAANLAGDSLVQPHPFLLRLYGSFAATIFIFLAGTMVAYGSARHTLGHSILRGGLIVLVGAGIDAGVWRVYPFTTFDVLYLIGFSLPIATLISRLKPVPIVCLAALIVLAGPLLRAAFGYAAYPLEIVFGNELPGLGKALPAITSHWLIDGFFPVFPWTAAMLFGVAFGLERRSNEKFCDCLNPAVIIGAMALLVVGCIVWVVFPGELIVRKGYSELFYPPTIGHFVTALGVVAAGFVFFDGLGYSSSLWFLRVLGRHSLAIYVAHLVAIEVIARHLDTQLTLKRFALAYALLVAGLVALAALLDRMMRLVSRPPFLVRFLLGA